MPPPPPRASWLMRTLLATALAAPLSAAQEAASELVHFNRDVRPLLAEHCLLCHGPDEQERRGGLRLDQADGPEGAYRTRRTRQAIHPGSLAESEVWQRLNATNPSKRMPPPDSHPQPLSGEELDLFRRWIEQGAVYQDHWAFVAPTPPPPAAVVDQAWCQQPMDRFVLQELESAGMNPSPRAELRTLLRRLSFDLTGLPPTREEIRRFLSDSSASPANAASSASPASSTSPAKASDEAYERLVDRLLAEPQYGEHMAKYWLDLVRFADTNGVHHDHYREMSLYRDWVIRSWNVNLPFDEFLVDQVAGDLHPDPSDDQWIASGFNRLHMIIDVGTALPEESLARNVIDRVTAVGTAFLGLTVQCAVCHDHKYDPFTQRDFFQLSAFFNNLDAAPETGSGALDKKQGVQPPYIRLPSEAQASALRELDRALAAIQAAPPPAKGAGSEKEKSEKQKKLQSERDKLLLSIPTAMVMKERTAIRPAFILLRGAYDNPGEKVARNTPDFLPPLHARGDPPTRMDLARWLVSRDHPLTARVTVNRIWQQLFGVGLVKTSEDFGTQGEWPEHLALLDHLTVSFMDSGWDVKALIKQIVLSATYQQSSIASPEDYARDPENRRLARGSRFRMDSEMIRDQILATSGLLSPTMYGKSVKPPQPEGVWRAVTLPGSYPRSYEADQGEKIYRRSIYTFWKRGMPPPQMSLLNAPTRESCTARRERTNTPLQALLSMNETEYLKAARRLAATTLATTEQSSEARLRIIYETLTSQLPDAAETQLWLQAVKDLNAMYTEHATLAEALCAGIPLEDGQSPAELAAWTAVVSTIYGLDITRTRE